VANRISTTPSAGENILRTGTPLPDDAVARSARRKAYRNIVFPLFLVSVIAYIDRVNVGYAALTMNHDLNFGPEVFGFAAGILFGGYLLFGVPGALVAERFGARLWLSCITVAWGVTSGLIAFVHTPMQFFIVRFLLGAAEASLYPVAYSSFIPRWFGARERPLAIAVLLTSLQMSGIIGAPLAGWLLGVSLFGFKGWQVLFLLEAIPAIVLGFALPFWMADWPRQARWLTPQERQLLAQRYETELAAKSQAKAYTVWQAFADPEVLKLCFIYFLWTTGFWGFNYWMPTILKEVSGWSNSAIGAAFAAAMTLSLIASALTGYSSSKTNEKRWHGAVPLLLAALGMAGGAYAHEPRVYFFFMVLTAIGVYAPMSVWWSYPTSFLSGSAAAGAVGLINSTGNIGGFVGPYITGWFKQSTGSYHGAILYLTASLAAAALLILTLRKRLPS
jgi:MFS transporter, ACS family, tartrate transporter